MSAADPPQRGPWARKPVEQLVAETEDGGGLKRAVGALDLTALGIGAIIGTGIFVIIGEAIELSGPAIILSFLLAGITCVFSALSYSELASSIPVAGSAYTYGYATLGELAAWILGWDLILEYGVSVAAVAVGWGGYLQDLLASVFGLELPDSIAGPPGDGGTVNLPAVALVLGVASLLAYGVKESARANTVMVIFKVSILVAFVVVGLLSFDGGNLEPFAPDGFGGIESAAAVIFFAYIGFDAVSTTGEEANKPSRDLPIAIIGSLVIATVLYILVALTAVGLASQKELAGSDAPLTDALRAGSGIGSWAGDLLSLGALVAITSVVLTVLYGATRIIFTMARDGLFPRSFTKLNQRRVPARLTLGLGGFVALIAAFVPLSAIAELVSIGTLFAFLVVNLGVILLRRTQPELPRRFRVPLVPLLPGIGAALCVYLMLQQPLVTWGRFGLWMLAGLLVYLFYGRTHSRLQRGQAPRTGSYR
ncbi:MAG: putative amino acid permease [Solirubrobacterales bacterium]|jgi:APA family basic amino acid/polyamine antiporter|nr:putative amino acid permease [Solirubrobacterales bacterium]